MKKLLVSLFFFGCITSFSLAQELTPDMLVGEYEGKAEVLYEGSEKPDIDKKATLKVSKIEGDTLLFDFFVDEVDYDVKAYLKDGNIFVFNNRVEKGKYADEIFTAKNYSGDFVTSNQGEYSTEDNKLKISFLWELRYSDEEKSSKKYFYLEMKKK